MGLFDSVMSNAAASGYAAPKFNNAFKAEKKEETPSMAKNILGGALSKFEPGAVAADQRINGFDFGGGNSFIG
jgi:hypothetical protein